MEEKIAPPPKAEAASPAPPATAKAPGPVPAPEAPPDKPAANAPLHLKPGMRVQLGHRTGKVEVVRGGWVKPYDVRVRWDGQKYPLWLIFATLERDYERGALRLL